MNRSAAALAEATVQQQVGQLAEQVEVLAADYREITNVLSGE